MMNSSPEATKYDLLEAVIANYKAEGFEVFVNPPEIILPPLGKGYRPDAVAIRPDKKIAIEVVRPGEQSRDRIYHLRGRFSPQDNWELQILYVSQGTTADKIEILTSDAIQQATDEVFQLRNAGQQVAALVMGWSALEAIARALLPDRLGRPQPPVTLIEVLASEGYLTPSEADTLRDAAAVRNAAAHGRPDAAVTAAQLDALVSILRTLVGLLSKNAA